MVETDRIIRKGHLIFCGMLIVASIIEMSLSAWITSEYKSRHNSPNSDTTIRVQFILFLSSWTLFFSFGYAVIFKKKPFDPIASVLSHLVFLIVTWILWTAAVASINVSLGGILHCDIQNYFQYCGELNAILVFSWLIWALVTLSWISVVICGIRSAKRGEGYTGSLTAE